MFYLKVTVHLGCSQGYKNIQFLPKPAQRFQNPGIIVEGEGEKTYRLSRLTTTKQSKGQIGKEIILSRI